MLCNITPHYLEIWIHEVYIAEEKRNEISKCYSVIFLLYIPNSYLKLVACQIFGLSENDTSLHLVLQRTVEVGTKDS